MLSAEQRALSLPTPSHGYAATFSIHRATSHGWSGCHKEILLNTPGMLQKGSHGQSPLWMGATDPCRVVAKLHQTALLRRTAQSLARRVLLRRCPEPHGHPPSPQVPAPACPRPHPHPLTSRTPVHKHSGKLRCFRPKGPDLYFSCRKQVTAPRLRVALEGALTQPLFGSQRSLQRSRPSQAEKSFTTPTLQRPSLVPRAALPGAKSRFAFAPHSTVQDWASRTLLERTGSIAHRDAPAATGRTDTALLGTRQSFQKSRAAEKDLQSKIKQKSSHVQVYLPPTHRFQVTVKHSADQS